MTSCAPPLSPLASSTAGGGAAAVVVVAIVVAVVVVVVCSTIVCVCSSDAVGSSALKSTRCSPGPGIVTVAA
jgi:hypothetical protein